MFSVADFLDRAKSGAGIESDYRLAKVLGVGHSRVSNWRRGANAPDERAIVKLAEMSGDDAFHVLACVQSMRAANDDAADLWRRMADHLKSSASASAFFVAALIFLADGLQPAQAAALPSAFDAVALCIMSNAVARMAWRLAALVKRRRPACQGRNIPTLTTG